MFTFLRLLTLVSIAVVAALSDEATAQDKCAGSKIKAVGKKAACLLGLEAKEAAKAVASDPAKVQKCKGKFNSAFAKAELKGGCSTTGDETAIEAKVDAFVDDVDDELVPGANDSPATANRCASAKLKAAGKKAKASSASQRRRRRRASRRTPRGCRSARTSSAVPSPKPS